MYLIMSRHGGHAIRQAFKLYKASLSPVSKCLGYISSISSIIVQSVYLTLMICFQMLGVYFKHFKYFINQSA